MIHLICGPIGAGKTTYAIELAQQEGAIRFSEDDWFAELFVPDAPEGLLEQPMSVIGTWATSKYERCRDQIWAICQQLLNNNVSVVLDGAAANKEQRDAVREKAKQHKVPFQLHYINAPVALRKQRVIERNENQGETYSLDVTPEIFAHIEGFFIAPDGEELEDAIVVEQS